MADYKETEVAGKSWHRFSRIMINNPYMAQADVVCVEEEMVAVGEGRVIGQDAPYNLYFPFDPTEEFELLNPLTNEPIGPMSNGGTVHAMVYSYVMHEAKKRDARVAAELAAQGQPEAP